MVEMLERPDTYHLSAVKAPWSQGNSNRWCSSTVYTHTHTALNKYTHDSFLVLVVLGLEFLFITRSSQCNLIWLFSQTEEVLIPLWHDVLCMSGGWMTHSDQYGKPKPSWHPKEYSSMRKPSATVVATVSTTTKKVMEMLLQWWLIERVYHSQRTSTL
jgi:hypothetical protein